MSNNKLHTVEYDVTDRVINPNDLVIQCISLFCDVVTASLFYGTASEAGHSLNSDYSLYSEEAGYATNADNATNSENSISASFSEQSLYAENSISASYSDIAKIADVAILADTSSISVEADFSTSSSWASQSLSSGWAFSSVSTSYIAGENVVGAVPTATQADGANYAAELMDGNGNTFSAAGDDHYSSNVPVAAPSFTGSLEGTSSWANDANSASFASRSFAATSASWASSSFSATTASFASRSLSSSYAVTATSGASPSFTAINITASGNAILGAASNASLIQLRANSGRHPYLTMTDPYGIGPGWSSEEIFTISAPNDTNHGPQYVIMGTAGQGLMMFGNNGNVPGRKSGLPGADFFFDTRTDIPGVFKVYSMDVLGQQHVGLMQSESGSVGIGFQTEPVSTLDVYGNVTIGTGVAGVVPAPVNGLKVEGKSVLGETDVEGQFTTFAGFAAAVGAGITGNLTVTAGQYYSELVNGPGNFPEIDWNQGNVQKIYLVQGDNTISFINAQSGARYMLIVVQPTDTGGGTITWPTDQVKWPGGVLPTLTSTADAVDVIGFLYDGTPQVYYANISLNFAIP